jgi:hypothetical protein
VSVIRLLLGLSTDAATPQAVIQALQSLRWLPAIVLVVSCGIALLAVALIWRPRAGVLPELLPHVATSTLLLSISVASLALIGDLLGMPDRSHYTGMGVVWPRGISLAVSLLITGPGGYIVAFPLSLVALLRCRRARGV